MLDQTLALHRAGKLDEAEAGYRELLTSNPDDPEALHLLGMLRRQRRDFVEAIRLVRRASELAPDRHTYLLTLGGIEFHLRLWDAAKADFEAAIRLNPNLTAAYSALGQIALFQNDLDRAEQQFKLALRAGDERPDVLTGYGNTLLARGAVEDALKYLTRAAELSPGDAAAQASLGRAYVKQGMHAFGEKALENALKLKPDYDAARLVLAESQLLQGKFDVAQETLRALMNDPRMRPQAVVVMGDAARARGDLLAAINYYRDALRAKPQQPRAVEALAWCLARSHMPREAVAAYRAYLAIAPSDHAARRALAAVCAEMGLYADAAQAYREILAAQPDDADAQGGLAVVLEFDGALAQAAAAADTALIKRPQDAGVVFVRARADLRDGAADAALRRLDGLNPAPLNVAQRRARLSLRGLAHDALDNPETAYQDWIQARREGSVGFDLPLLSPLPKDLQTACARALERAGNAVLPAALLLGVPGSGVETIAALASTIPNVALLGDRLGRQPRVDAFNDGQDRYADLDESEVMVQARRYARGIERLKLAADAVALDWIPTWNARFLPLLLRLSASTRLIIVGREPRAALLNWLVYGCPQSYRFDDADLGAAFLARALSHLRATEQANVLPVLALDADTAAADLPGTAARIAQFLGQPAPDALSASGLRLLGLGGLPMALPPARALGYASSMPAAYATLNPLA